MVCLYTLFYIACLVFIPVQGVLYLTGAAQKCSIYSKHGKSARLKNFLKRRLHFLTNISHELRTPLTLIHSPLSMIIESGKYSSDKYLAGMLQTMEHNSKFLLSLVNQLMNFSKSEKGMLSLNLKYGNFSSFSKEVFQQFTYWAKSERCRAGIFCLTQ